MAQCFVALKENLITTIECGNIGKTGQYLSALGTEKRVLFVAWICFTMFMILGYM